MYSNFINFIQEIINIEKSKKLLLTIGGGADSVVMLDLFARNGYECGVAHCNFHLRGSDSDKDEELVKKLSKKYNYSFYKIDFDTEKYASDNGISIEMAARKLRYEWFEKIRLENNYDYIATAHHSDDVIETFFMNLARGTGIRGLSGIKALSGNIIRPILFADKEQINNYVLENKLEYRNDISNDDVKFKRNKLRHDIIPEFGSINPAYKQNILKTIERLNITNKILQEKITEIKAEIIEEKNDQLFIDIYKLKKLNKPNFHLFELLHPFGFNGGQTEQIIESLDGISGKIFYSNTHQLIKDRNNLIIVKKQQSEKELQDISEYQNIVKIKGVNFLELKTIKRTSDFKISYKLNIATLDKDKLKFPLKLRYWQKSDYFYPIGMNKRKKLSNFFIDNKFSKIEKDRTLLLVSEDNIVWIIGHRIDNRYKITDKTKNIVQISLIE